MKDRLLLSKLKLKNFKNLILESGCFSLNNLNIVIGPNGSGKSNLIGVLKFLSQAITPSVSPESGLTAFEQAVIALGDQMILDASIKPPSTINIGFEFTSRDDFPQGLALDLDLLIKGGNKTPMIKKELLYRPTPSDNNEKLSFYYEAHGKKSGTGVIQSFDKSGELSLCFDLPNVPDDRMTLEAVPELMEMTSIPRTHGLIHHIRRPLIEFIRDWRFYNANEMNSWNIREAEPKIKGSPDLYLSPSGENLPLVFDGLDESDITFRELINLEMQKILPDTRKIRAIRSGSMRLMMEWHMAGMSEPFHLTDMSDGTVRMLCWAVILNSPKLPSLIVIDEPEVGLHPAWMPALAQWLIKASEKTQVIVSTHSPDLLDHFTDQYDKVICFEFDGKKHYTPRKLSKALLQARFEEEWELGDLYRTGDPATGGWPW